MESRIVYNFKIPDSVDFCVTFQTTLMVKNICLTIEYHNCAQFQFNFFFFAKTTLKTILQIAQFQSC